ncbi:hypothetical protein [Thiocapsa sp.]|uniref:hypothetical protein n=1 Tax=Thiocapsa sp. TaxID=2024551 RepID=UPI0026049C9F|nr:hypothetical protein [Thiocapsa sp.]
MDTFKTPVARLARLFRASRDAWRAKALDKQQRLRAARVKIRDLEASRAYWKTGRWRRKAVARLRRRRRHRSARRRSLTLRLGSSCACPRPVTGIRSWSFN